MSWAAIGVGLLVLYLLVFRPWPHEVREREPEAQIVAESGGLTLSSASRRRESHSPSRSLTSLYDQENDGEWGDAA